MRSFPVCSDSAVSWRLFASDCAGISKRDVDSPAHISAVLAEVREVFVDIFGPETVNAHPLLSVLYSEEGPICFRRQCLIFISSQGDDYNRHIFEFSHELCHFMVPGDTCPEYHWLNETLCLMMSWYAIRRIHQNRKTSPCKEILKDAYDSMEQYIRNDKALKADLSDGITVPKYIRQNLEHLRQNGCDYRRDRVIACEIFPLFCEHPELWRIVPFLSWLEPDLSLDTALAIMCINACIPPDVWKQLVRMLCDDAPEQS